jgi:hypothetical protein
VSRGCAVGAGAVADMSPVLMAWWKGKILRRLQIYS